jgi:hypothetical protein
MVVRVYEATQTDSVTVTTTVEVERGGGAGLQLSASRVISTHPVTPLLGGAV